MFCLEAGAGAMWGSVGKDPRLRTPRRAGRAPWVVGVCWIVGATLVGFALPRLGSTYALLNVSSSPASATISTLSGATSFYVTPLTRPVNLGQFVKGSAVSVPNVLQIRNDSGRDLDLSITLVQDSAPKISPYSLSYPSTLPYGQIATVNLSGTTAQPTGTITGYFHITGLSGFLTLDVGITGKVTNPSGKALDRALLDQHNPSAQDPQTVVTIPAGEQPVLLPDTPSELDPSTPPVIPIPEPTAPPQEPTPEPTASVPTGETPVLIPEPDAHTPLPPDPPAVQPQPPTRPEPPTIQPEPPAPRPEPPATQPEPPATQPKPPATQPVPPVTLPEPAVILPGPPPVQPDPPVTQPSVPGTQPEANAPQRGAPRPRPGGVTPPQATVPERETPLAP